MPELIAGTYENLGYIGAGGGGNVFLARHLRLDKLVVLKGDKRKVTARPELLRREVDVLKNLSHSYIPKVFDYFIENETVYTVMDYIEGESLDKPLKRGEKFPQPQVIEWAKELLEALEYLHSPTHGAPPRGYVHSDIKPANLMLTPFGTICLIDFNIALALGEENVVGASAGYASPEHYGLDYSSGFTALNKTQRLNRPNEKTVLLNSEFDDKTEVLNDFSPDEKTELLRPRNTDNSQSSSASIRRVTPDVRSDIYSTGATLYHLLSGKRPATNALKTVPLSDKEFSAPLAAIINKAMNPNPNLRYQSAAEMLYDFEHIRENDQRVKRQRRSLKVFEIGMAACFAVGVFASFTGLKRMQATENALKLSEYAHNAMQQGNTAQAVDYALQALPTQKTVFTPAPTAEAQAALTEVLQVYDLSDSFKADIIVELPSAPLDMAVSPDEKTFVCICSGKTLIFNTKTGEKLAELQTDKSALSQVKYVDEDTVAYAAEGAVKAYSVSQKRELWSGEAAISIEISADGGTVATLYKDNAYAVLYDAKTGMEKSRVDFGGRKQRVVYNDSFFNPQDSLFAVSRNGKYLAASFDDGTVCVWETGGELLIEVPTAVDTQFSGGFCGEIFAMSAVGQSGSAFLAYDLSTDKSISSEAGYPMYVTVDENGVHLKTENKLVRLDTSSGEQTPLIATSEAIHDYAFDSEHSVISTKDGVRFFDKNAREISRCENPDNKNTFDFVRLSGDVAVIGSQNSSTVRVLKYESRADANVFDYDSTIKHNEARISADGKHITLFNFKEFSVFDIGGKLIKNVELPDADKIYDQQYVRENGESVLEVTYYSGKTTIYSGADGSLLREEQREAHDKEIEDVFLIDKFKIVSPLHGAPRVYDKNSEKLLTELNEEAYLTYIAQSGDYIIAQYIKTNGEFYGVLMNEKCETLARLPNLCDVWNGELYFDYPTGNLRKSRIYTLDELIELAQNK